LYPAGRAELLLRAFAGAIPKVRESDGRVAVKLLLSNGDVRPLEIAFNIPNDVMERTRRFRDVEFKDSSKPSQASSGSGYSSDQRRWFSSFWLVDEGLYRLFCADTLFKPRQLRERQPAILHSTVLTAGQGEACDVQIHPTAPDQPLVLHGITPSRQMTRNFSQGAFSLVRTEGSCEFPNTLNSKE